MNVLDNIKKNAHDSGFAEGYEKGYEKGFKKGVDASVKVILYGVIQFLGDKRGWHRRSIFEAIRWLHKHSEMILENYTTFDEVVEAVRSEYGIICEDTRFMLLSDEAWEEVKGT